MLVYSAFDVSLGSFPSHCKVLLLRASEKRSSILSHDTAIAVYCDSRTMHAHSLEWLLARQYDSYAKEKLQ